MAENKYAYTFEFFTVDSRAIKKLRHVTRLLATYRAD